MTTEPEEESAPLAPAVPAIPAAAPSLLPKMRVGMYDEPEPSTGAAAEIGGAAGLLYDAPVGPALGPSSDVTGAYSSAEPYSEAPPYGFDEGNVIEISQEALKKAMGQAKQYDFAVPAVPTTRARTLCALCG